MTSTELKYPPFLCWTLTMTCFNHYFCSLLDLSTSIVYIELQNGNSAMEFTLTAHVIWCTTYATMGSPVPHLRH